MSVEYGSAGSEPERVVATLRPHGRALFWPSLVLIAVVGATGYLFGRFDDEMRNLAVLGAGAAVVLLFWLLLSWRLLRLSHRLWRRASSRRRRSGRWILRRTSSRSLRRAV